MLQNVNKYRAQQLLLILFFITGFSGLVYEVLWVRMFTLIFGATVFAVSTVLTAFFTGLALGSYLFGRMIDRFGKPLLIYGLLELGIGAYALLLPLLLSQIQGIYIAISQQWAVSFYTFSVIRFILCFFLLLFPTTLMGGTLPVLSKFMVEARDRVGRDIGYLYAINTIGATLGCLVTGFFFIELLGISRTHVLALVLNLLVGVVALSLHPMGQPVLVSTTRPQPSRGARPNPGEVLPDYSPSLILLILGAFALSGAAALGYEVLWTRVLSPIFYSTTYSFTLMLTTFLCGLALGSYLYGRYFHEQKRLILSFGVIQILIGFYALALIPIFRLLPDVTSGLIKPVEGSWLATISIQFLLSFLVMLIPTLLLGALFPLVSRICTANMEKLGMTIGKVYAFNTLGAIFGSFLAGFVLIPLMGVKEGMIIVAALNVIIGLIVLGYSSQLKGIAKLATVTATGMVLGIGLFLTHGTKLYAGVSITAGQRKVLYYKEDLVANVWIEQTADDLFLMINNDIQTSQQASQVYQGMGHLPMLLHADPRRVLLIGMGGGITAGAVGRHPVQEIDIVELVPSLQEAASFFSSENHDILKDPRTQLIIGDGRNYLLTTQKQYDVIISEIFYPETAGTGSLYSLEHYQLARERLADHGMMVQWLTLHQLSEEEFKVIAATFQEVFPHVTVWLLDLDMVFPTVGLVGTEQPLKINYRRLKEQLTRTGASEELPYGSDAIDLLGSFLMAGPDLSEYVGDPPLNTDDHPYIEFSTPRNKWRTQHLGWINIQRLIPYKRSIHSLLELTGLPEEERETFIEKLADREEARRHFFRGAIFQGKGQKEKALQEYALARSLIPDDSLLHFTISWNLGRLFAKRGEWEAARKELEHAIRIRPKEIDPHLRLADVYIQLGQWDLAEHHLAEIVRLQPDHARAYSRLGEVYFQQGRLDAARRALTRAIEIFPYDDPINALYARVHGFQKVQAGAPPFPP